MRAQIYVSSSASPLLKSFDLGGGGGVFHLLYNTDCKTAFRFG